MSTPPSRGRRIWERIRVVWATLGITAFVVFTGWSLIAYRASGTAQDALESDAAVTVSRDGDLWRFEPAATSANRAGLLFVPGALVDPVAYAPLLHAVAAAGHEAVLLTLPRRGAFGGADDPAIPGRVRSVMQRPGGPTRWFVAGHSKGGVVATNIAHASADALAGLILIGTSHPRDVSLAEIRIPVTKVIGTRDGLASVAEVEQNSHLLPPQTRWVRIDGGNHSQFGWYGFQPGDRRATISAEQQRKMMLDAVLETLGASH
jgi:pimeloyl-ACP methyl ester carboxylesterase